MSASIRLFYVYRIVSRMYFHLSVLFIYFYMMDLPVWQIELLLAVYAITLLLTSKLNALMLHRLKMKHKHVIAIGELIKAAGLLLLLADGQLPILAAGQALSGLGYSLAQGTDSSLLRAVATDPGQYGQAESGSSSYTFASFLLSGIVGSILFHYSAEYVFWGSVCANAAAAAAVMLIREPALARSGAAQRAVQPAFTEERSPRRFWMLYYSLTRAFAMAVFTGFLPYYFFVNVKVDLQLFGLVLSLFTLLGFVAARYIMKAGGLFGYRKLAAASALLTALSLLLFGSSSHIAAGLAAIAVLGLAAGGVRPLTVNNLSLAELDPAKRTAILSSMERSFGLMNALLLIGGGILLEYAGFQWLMLASAAIYGILLVGGSRLLVFMPSATRSNASEKIR